MIDEAVARGHFQAHEATLRAAAQAARERGYWSAYPEVPSGRIYGESARADASAAFQAMLGQPFDLDQPGETRVGAEASPYGFDLGITYPSSSVGTLVERAKAACEVWGEASVEARVGVALEILSRLNRQSFLIAEGVQHTSGQAFVMAFQAGGPHAQDRGLEAVAYAFEEMTRIPGAVTWTKPQGKGEPLVLDKVFRLVPRGVAVAIGCATFPTWNTYPGLFASLVTGNPVIVKPHPGAILPLALTVKIARAVLGEAGLPEDVVQLAPDTVEHPIAKDLVTHPDVAIVDFTGSPAFGEWIRAHAGARQVYTEEAGVNAVIVHSTGNYRGLLGNIAFSLALYSGQMCTAPQNIFVPADGIDTDQGRKSFDEVAADLAKAMDKLLGDADRAAAVLGAVQNPTTIERVAAASAREGVTVVRPAATVDIPGFPKARALSPAILAVAGADEGTYGAECFGPVSFLVKVPSSHEAVAIAARHARTHGAITASLYTTDDGLLSSASKSFAAAGVALSVNLTGQVFVNQSAAFSDYHVSGANPAGTASLTDTAFVAGRFRVVTIRRQTAT